MMNRAMEARREMARRELARRGFQYFPGYVDPRQAGSYGAEHLQLMARWLERAESGELWEGIPGEGVKILIIEAPPRHWKTSLVNKFAAWFVGGRAREGRPHQLILASYGADLATTNSRVVMATIRENERYGNLFPGLSLSSVMQAAGNWGLEGEERPTCVAAGVGGALTGHGADCLIIDDPVKDFADAGSVASRNAKWQWWQTVGRTRINPGGFVILILTRWHEDDLAGRLLAQVKEGLGDRVALLRLPALAETDQERGSAGKVGLPVDEGDPLGREPGEALWPERYSAEELEDTRSKGPNAFESLYQGRPRREGGYLIGRESFRMLEVPPSNGSVKWIIPTDWAMTEKELTPKRGNDPDYTVVGLLGLWTPDEAAPTNTRIVLAAVRRGRKRLHDAKAMVKEFALQVEKRLEERPPIVAAQDNIDAIALDGLRGDPELLNWSISNIPRKEMPGDKVVKSAPWRDRAAGGRVYVVEEAWWGPRWNEAFFHEVEGFPRGAHDDQVDLMSCGMHRLSNRMMEGDLMA